MKKLVSIIISTLFTIFVFSTCYASMTMIKHRGEVYAATEGGMWWDKCDSLNGCEPPIEAYSLYGWNEAKAIYGSTIYYDNNFLNVVASGESWICEEGDAWTEMAVRFEILDGNMIYTTTYDLYWGTYGGLYLENLSTPGWDTIFEYDEEADGSNEGTIGPGTYELFWQVYGGTGSFDIEFTASSVPIPGAVWLLGSGLIGIVGVRRKLKK